MEQVTYLHPVEPLGIGVAEVAGFGGPSRAEVYRLIASGALRSYRLGRRRMVFLAEVRTLIEEAAARSSLDRR